MIALTDFKPIINTNLQLAYEHLIKVHEFTTFITITFRENLHPDTIKKKIRDFLAHINDKDVIFYEKVLYAWIFIERNSYSRYNHVHLLTKNIDPDKYPLLEKELYKFGRSQVKASHNNTIAYVAKKYSTEKLLDDQLMTIHSRRDRALKKKNRLLDIFKTS